jgi:L-iditol 2-dehydrogenase
VDLTPIWFRELTVHGAYGRQIERLDGREVGTYKLAHELLVSGKIKTTGWLTHTFPLSDYRTAFNVAMHKGAHQAVKVAFEFR